VIFIFDSLFLEYRKIATKTIHRQIENFCQEKNEKDKIGKILINSFTFYTDHISGGAKWQRK